MERRRTIFVHIGTHKTGTTSIQHFLVHNADDLQRGGILVPAAGRHLFGHHHVAWELRNDRRLAGGTGHVRQLCDELRSSTLDRAVLSSEDFEYLSQYPAALQAFVAALREIGFEPVFIVFFRERAAYLASLAAALANHGVTHTMDWYRERVQADEAILVKDDWWFDFNRTRFVARWADLTGGDVVAIDYDACPTNDGVVPTFLEAIGADGTLVEAARSWPRLNARPL